MRCCLPVPSLQHLAQGRVPCVWLALPVPQSPYLMVYLLYTPSLNEGLGSQSLPRRFSVCNYVVHV